MANKHERPTIDQNAHVFSELNRGVDPEVAADIGYALGDVVAEATARTAVVVPVTEEPTEPAPTYIPTRRNSPRDRANADRYSSPDGTKYRKV